MHNVFFKFRFQYIEKKSPEDICIWLNGTSIKYSQTIVKENHLSTCLRKHIEQWLRGVLEFDAAKRGVINGAPDDVFLSLRKVLCGKIVKVFDVKHFKLFNYDIDEYTTFGDVKCNFEVDTNMLKSTQLLLSDSNGTEVIDSVKLFEYFPLVSV